MAVSAGASGPPELHAAASVEEAVRELAALGGDGAVLAGGTWVLRTPIRGETWLRRYVALAGIEELTSITPGDPTVIGALATHATLAGLDGGAGPLGALAEAARTSSFPAIRNVATLGGNLRVPLPGADLVPPLLAAEARVDLASPSGRESLELPTYLSSRSARPAGELIVAVSVPTPAGRRSAYERLALRAGDYPVVAVALSIDFDGATVRQARVAVGAVEETPRRLAAAEAALRGAPLGREAAEAAGRAAAGELAASDGVDAPGWYRLAVLPELFARAVERLA